MGEIHWLLGVEIKRDRLTQTVTLSQKAYIDAICEWFSLQDVCPATTPMEAGVQLTDAIENKQRVTYPFKEIIGSLMYAATAMWLDIAFTTSILAQFNQNPARVHWEAAKQVVRYLKTTCNLELTYGTSHVNIIGYSVSCINLAWNYIQLPTLHLSPYLNTNSLFIPGFPSFVQ